jgi:predicted aspartyl protease
VCVLLAFFPAVAQERAAADLKSLYEAHQWVQLRDAIAKVKGPAFYRGAVGVAFHDDPRQVEKTLRSVIKSAPRSEEAYQGYECLAHLYFLHGQYRRLISNMEERWAAFPNKSERTQEQSAMAGFRGLPDQAVGKARPSTLAHESGSIFIHLSVNGAPATYFFDTGAWVSCMSESEARRLGLRIHETSGTLGTATGVRVGFRTAVAREVVAGNTHFRNVSFAIFPDGREPWSALPPGRRGLLGIPILVGFRTLRWVRDGAVEIGRNTGPVDARKSNLYFDDDHLVIAATLQGRRVLATLDTGAETTDLYEGFAREFAALLGSGKKDSTEVRGVGHAETFDSITVPELRFRVGGLDTILHPAHVLRKQIGAKCCVGNFGMDLLKQARAFTIDFGAMTLELEAGQ